MIFKEFTIIQKSEPHVHDVDGACQWCLVMQKVRERLPITAEQSNRVRFETCGYKSDDSTPAHTPAIEGPCSEPIANPELLKHVIEIPHGWRNAIYHSSFQQYVDKLLLNGRIAGGIGRKEGSQACYFSAAHPQQSKAAYRHNL